MQRSLQRVDAYRYSIQRRGLITQQGMDYFINHKLTTLRIVAQTVALLQANSSAKIDLLTSCPPMPIHSELSEPLKQNLWCLLTSNEFSSLSNHMSNIRNPALLHDKSIPERSQRKHPGHEFFESQGTQFAVHIAGLGQQRARRGISLCLGVLRDSSSHIHIQDRDGDADIAAPRCTTQKLAVDRLFGRLIIYGLLCGVWGLGFGVWGFGFGR